MSRVYAGWGFSQAFYWDEVYKEKLGFSSLEDFLVGFWEGFFLDGRDANNLLTMLWTWQNGDVGKTPGIDGPYEEALGRIRAKAIIMPAEKDLYFPPEDEEYAVGYMTGADAELRVIPGVWGHFAGGGLKPGGRRVHRQCPERAARQLEINVREDRRTVVRTPTIGPLQTTDPPEPSWPPGGFYPRPS